MPPAGFPQVEWDVAQTRLSHANSGHCCTIPGNPPIELAYGYDGSNQYLYERSGDLPANAGDPGDFVKSVNSAGGDVQLDGRSSAQPLLWWDDANNHLHVFNARGTTSHTYKLWSYNPATGEFTIVIGDSSNGEAVGITAGADSVSFLLDSQGRPTIFWSSPTGVFMKVREAGGWAADVNFENYGASLASGEHRTAAAPYLDASGNPGVCVVYNSNDGAVNQVKWSFRLDSESVTSAAGLIANTEVLRNDVTIDNHLSMKSFGTPSTCWIARKNVTNDIYAIRRGPAGSVFESADLGNFTRPQVMICFEGSSTLALIICHNTNQVRVAYLSFDATVDPSVIGPLTTLLETDGIESANNDADVPLQNADANTGGFLVRGQVGASILWNKYLIAQNGGGGNGGGLSLNDAKFASLGAKGATAPDITGRYRQWLIASTAGSTAEMDTATLEERYLDAQLVPAGNLSDRWYAWLGVQGHTQGDLNDRWYAFWVAGIP